MHSDLQGRVKVPTGGKAREPKGRIPVRFRSRQLQSGWEKMVRYSYRRVSCAYLLYSICSGIFLIPELFCWQKAKVSCAVEVRSEDRSERIFVFPEVLS